MTIHVCTKSADYTIKAITHLPYTAAPVVCILSLLQVYKM